MFLARCFDAIDHNSHIHILYIYDGQYNTKDVLKICEDQFIHKHASALSMSIVLDSMQLMFMIYCPKSITSDNTLKLEKNINKK